MSSEALTLKVLPLQSVFAAPPIGLDPVNSYAPIKMVACLDSPSTPSKNTLHKEARRCRQASWEVLYRKL